MATPPDNSTWLNRLAGRAIARYIKFAYRTSRRPKYVDEATAVWRANHPAILGFWHGQFLLIPAVHQPDLPTEVMVARHRDAEILGVALRQFDMALIRGAGAGKRQGDRGGMNAFRAAVHALADGASVGMTADVPPGPARRAGLGIVTLAKVSGRPILPIALASSHYKAFNTWSRMTLNLPFSQLGAWMGPPIFVPADADDAELERLRRVLEDSLNETTARAYDMAGADAARALPGHLLATLGRPIEPGRKLKLYRGLTRVLAPLAPFLLARRARRGKEDPARRDERFGIAGIARGPGQLAWFHAASVGETNTVLPLMNALLAARPGLSVLLTTGTVTSARLADTRLDPRAVHQYVPLDVPRYIRHFLDHWRPTLAVFVESEIWPNMILETASRGVPLALVNARMSKTSFRRWRANPGVARPLFSRFAAVLAQNAEFAERFGALGSGSARAVGNLKIDVPPLPIDASLHADLGAAIGGRPWLLAASTHEGEEDIIAAAHRRFAAKLPGALTVIVPRHPERGPTIAEKLRGQGFGVALRSASSLPDDRTDIYIADSIGELGTFYSLATLALIGGSLVPRGGHNPIEAIRLDVAVLTGPHWFNFADTFDSLHAARAIEVASSAEELGDAAARLLTDAAALAAMRARATAACARLEGALPRTLEALLALLPAAASATPSGPGPASELRDAARAS